MQLGFVRKIRVLSAFESKSFTLFWLGQTLSAMGNDAYGIALLWTVLAITGSAQATALVGAIEEVPRVAFLLLGGVAADRLQRRKVILWADAGRAVLVILIAVLTYLHLLQLWHLVLSAFIFGTVRGFFSPAYRSLLPQLAEKEKRASVNALNGFSRQGSELIGPLLGGGLFALGGAVIAFAFDAVTFLVSACCMLGVQPVQKQASSPAQHVASPQEKRPVASVFRSVGSEIAEGFRYVFSISWIWITIVIVAIGATGTLGMVEVALPKLLKTTHSNEVGAILLGAIISSMALGTLLSTVVLGQFHIRRRGIIAFVGLICTGLWFFLFTLPLSFPLASAIFIATGFLIGFSSGIFDISWDMLLQATVSEDKLGRVYSIYLLAYYSLSIVGLLIAGFISDHIGPQWMFLVGGVLSICIGGIALFFKVIRQLSDDSAS